MLRQNRLNRIGFHYYPDYFHYREADLHTWLPRLAALGAGWLTVLSAPDRTIPEFFLRALLLSGIQPLVHIPALMQQPGSAANIKLLLESYARWGVRYVAVFDRPNLRSAWPTATWTRTNLVERFLDEYLPLANQVQQLGMTPIFPPLEPAGDYWDTAFLLSALQGIERRGHAALLSHMALGAYAWSSNRPLNWGAGGPERWPQTRPYSINPHGQDQLGFRIFDWYLAIAKAVIAQPLPVLLLRAGSRPGDCTHPNTPAVDLAAHTRIHLALAELLAGGSRPLPDGLEPVNPAVVACNFWLLAAAPTSPHKAHAWYHPDGGHLPIVDALTAFQSAPESKSLANPAENGAILAHYLLLPSFEWGVSDWHLEAIRPFIKKYRPTIGFSLDEACHAQRVTVVGEHGSFSDEAIQKLLAAGCIVEQIRASGTELATLLAEK